MVGSRGWADDGRDERCGHGFIVPAASTYFVVTPLIAEATASLAIDGWIDSREANQKDAEEGEQLGITRDI